MTFQVIRDLSYLFAAVLFIFGLKRLSSPATARTGNMIAATGMLIAVVVTLLDQAVLNYTQILIGIAIGSVIGAAAARLVKMTDMPQMVGIFNGFGGGASALVAAGEFWRLTAVTGEITFDASISIMAGVLIGGVTFSGSFIAFGKLQGFITGAPVTFPLQKTLNAIMLLGAVGISGYLIVVQPDWTIFLALAGVALILGVLAVISIGGADMPVVISLLNSYSGLAASAAGFAIDNKVLIIAGALVGASGLILTRIMCVAMNRSLANVLFGAVGTADVKGAVGPGVIDTTVRETNPEEADAAEDGNRPAEHLPTGGVEGERPQSAGAIDIEDVARVHVPGIESGGDQFSDRVRLQVEQHDPAAIQCTYHRPAAWKKRGRADPLARF